MQRVLFTAYWLNLHINNEKKSFMHIHLFV
jgi:hypothetical protein